MSHPFPLSAAIKKFLLWAEKNLAPGTVADYQRHLLRFQAAVGDLDLAELRAHHLVDWGRTWHNIVAVQRCFNWLVEMELIARTPFKRVKRPRPGRRRRIFTHAEFLRLCRAASADFRAFLIALRETIARPQEVRALRWDELESADNSLSLDEALRSGRAYFALENYKAKARRADPHELRIVPVSRRLGRLLLRIGQTKIDPRGQVFRTSRGNPWTKEATRLRLSRLRKRLQLGRDVRGERLVCYSVRHTQATAAAAAGMRDRILADVMGHTNTRTTARYQHLQPTHILDAMEELRGKKKRESRK